VPCSTGEEPFSIVMALLGACFPPGRFHIEAIDISLLALERATHATYGKNSFRSKDLGYRDRYFFPVENGYRLSEEVRRHVHFRHGNLLAPGWLHGAHGYHVIFCRNVLIYFDSITQRRALDVLARLLAPAGLLFVGPSEAGLLLGHGYLSAGFPHAFAFRPPDAAVPAPSAKRTDVPSASAPSSRRLGRPKHAPAIKLTAPTLDAAPTIGPLHPLRAHGSTGKRSTTEQTSEQTSGQSTNAAGDNWLDTARRLADQGKVAEALQYCDERLKSQPPSAETFYLIGLLHDAAGRVREASEHYRKALYLDPHHAEALVHLAVTLQKEGDTQGAQRLIQRANRQLSPRERRGRR
jgi:chemotaxis protein methyltransferase WspC